MKFFHNIVPHHFLETARVCSIPLPAVRSIHAAELLVLLDVCAQQSQLNVEVARNVETFGSALSSISQNLCHSLHEFVKFFQVLPEPSAYTLMTLGNPKRTAAHLSSDRHVPCEISRRSDTRREVSPNTFSQTTHPGTCMSSAVHELVFCNARITGTHRIRVQQSRHDQLHTHSTLSVDVRRYKVQTSAKGSMLKGSSQI